MDKYQTIHIVSEIAVLTMMFLHFDKKTKNMQAEIEHIKKTYISTFDDLYQKIELLKQGILVNNNSVNIQKQVINDLKNIRPFEPKITVIEDETSNTSNTKETVEKDEKNVTKITETINNIDNTTELDSNENSKNEEQITDITDVELTEIEEMIENNNGKTD